jgi:ABC-type multidrug transport system permease subunit
MYGLTPYFITKNVIELPVSLVQPLIMLAISYWGIGLNEPKEHFLKYYIILMLLSQVATGFGYVCSSSFSSPDSAIVASNLITLPTMLFGGLFVNLSTIPVYIRWIRWTSPINYCFQALVRT